MQPAELAGHHAGDGEEHAGAQHLHRRGDQGPAGEPDVAGEDRAGCPAQWGGQCQRRAKETDVTRAGRSDQERHPTEANDQAHDHQWRQASTKGNSIDDRHPEWRGGNQQRDHTGRDILLRQDDAAVAADQQGGADHKGRQPLAGSQPVAAGIGGAGGDGVQDAARHQKPHRAHQQRWDSGDRVLDAEIGRPPQEVDRPQRQPDTAGRAGHPGAGLPSKGAGQLSGCQFSGGGH